VVVGVVDADREVSVLDPPSERCAYQATVRLSTPLRGRPVMDRAEHTQLPVLHERILPRPTYPASLRPNGAANQALHSPRPTWIVGYDRPGGGHITISATRKATAPTVPVVERLTVGGHLTRIADFPGAETATWTAEGWNLAITVDPAPGHSSTLDELHRILQGMTWPCRPGAARPGTRCGIEHVPGARTTPPIAGQRRREP
jgi:hypothetical protein